MVRVAGLGAGGSILMRGTQRGRNMSSERRVSDKQLTNKTNRHLFELEIRAKWQIDGLGDTARIIIAI